MIPMIHPTRDINGTCLQGYITIKFSEIVEVLGKPTFEDGDKVTAEWSFKTHNNIVFTLYDYKEDSTPKGEYSWHIGGHDQRAMLIVQRLFPTHFVRSYRA